MDRATYHTLYVVILLALTVIYTLTAAYSSTVSRPASHVARHVAQHRTQSNDVITAATLPVRAYVEVYLDGRRVYTGSDPININMALIVWHLIIGTRETTYIYTMSGSRVNLYCMLRISNTYVILGNDTNTTYSFERVNMTIAYQMKVTQVYLNNNTVYLYTGAILDTPLNVTSIGLAFDIYHTCWLNQWYHAGLVLATYDPLSQPLILDTGDNITVVYALVFPDNISAKAFYNALRGTIAISNSATLEVHTFDPITNTTCSFAVTNYNSKWFTKPTYVKIVGLGYTQSTCTGYVMYVLIQKSYWYESGGSWYVSNSKITTFNITVSQVGFHVNSGEPFAVALEFRIPKPAS